MFNLGLVFLWNVLKVENTEGFFFFFDIFYVRFNICGSI